MLNGIQYSCPCWLADGIYPQLAVFITAFALPNNDVDQNFTYWQESIWKDMEWPSGVLQACWIILKHPAWQMDPKFLDDILECCIILHNIIVEDEHDLHYDTGQNEYGNHYEYDDYEGNIFHSLEFHISVKAPRDAPGPFASMLQRIVEVNDALQH